ncbi:terpene synthase family protein [Actinophytocola sediminis]
MAPFEMPEFYMPFPARLNPHLSAARDHARNWAERMGMLGPEQQAWNAASFDRADYASFAAWNYPDASEQELELLVDWHVWGFFLDDEFVENYGREFAPDVVRGFLDRMAALMPLFPPSPVVPANPLERGLADLWPRTAYSKSVRWRHRFSGHIRRLGASALREKTNVNDKVIPDPIDYTALRRATGGMDFSACLVEHALGVEVPAGLDRTRPIQVLKDTFADSDLWRNDIVSFQKEIDEEGQTNNGVLVVQQLLRCDLQHAVDRVNDLVTSRLRQFEHTAEVELPELLDRLHLDPLSRKNIGTYVKGLQDWLAGDLQWTVTTGRYSDSAHRPDSETFRIGGPTGLGTAAARIPSLADTLQGAGHGSA